MRYHTLMVVLALSSLLAACAGSRRDEAAYTLIYLKTGPNSAGHTPEEKKEVFQGHMANMTRLAHERVLLIAGPFVQPRDRAWRGIFLFDVADAAEASRIAGSDPGVSSGEFVADVVPVRGGTHLRGSLDLENALQERLKAEGVAERKPGEPPPSLRPYAIAHAADVRRAVAAIGAAPGAPRVVWSVQRVGGRAGVIVLDAESADAARGAISGVDTGLIEVDGWYSTKAIEGLAETASTPR